MKHNAVFARACTSYTIWKLLRKDFVGRSLCFSRLLVC